VANAATESRVVNNGCSPSNLPMGISHSAGLCARDDKGLCARDDKGLCARGQHASIAELYELYKLIIR